MAGVCAVGRRTQFCSSAILAPVQSIAALIMGGFGLSHLAIGQVLSEIWAKQCSQPGGSEQLLYRHKLVKLVLLDRNREIFVVGGGCFPSQLAQRGEKCSHRLPVAHFVELVEQGKLEVRWGTEPGYWEEYHRRSATAEASLQAGADESVQFAHEEMEPMGENLFSIHMSGNAWEIITFLGSISQNCTTHLQEISLYVLEDPSSPSCSPYGGSSGSSSPVVRHRTSASKGPTLDSWTLFL
ncbi:hypothetical protein B0H13DRAFT_2367156 [Mycena leptocephala]|nr:hypothetical protein B0H13DRAFT_2367156 [Mycena leptocephala]